MSMTEHDHLARLEAMGERYAPMWTDDLESIAWAVKTIREHEARIAELEAQKNPPVSMGTWRVGRKVPLNVYDADRPVCQCHDATDAQAIVDALNRADGRDSDRVEKGDAK